MRQRGGGLLGTLERDRVELVAEAQEPIVELAVREGESVAAGRVLLKLDATAAEARLAQARATGSRPSGGSRNSRPVPAAKPCARRGRSRKALRPARSRKAANSSESRSW